MPKDKSRMHERLIAVGCPVDPLDPEPESSNRDPRIHPLSDANTHLRSIDLWWHRLHPGRSDRQPLFTPVLNLRIFRSVALGGSAVLLAGRSTRIRPGERGLCLFS